MLLRQYECVFPRILELISGGATLSSALRQTPSEPALDSGAFTRWMYADPQRRSLYNEAKEVRAEMWTGEMLRHATGQDENGEEIPTELDRSKFIVDTYKWLVSRQNRKDYGDTKTIEMNTTISITAALQAANERVIQATVLDDGEEDSEEYYLPSKSTSPAYSYDDGDDE